LLFDFFCICLFAVACSFSGFFRLLTSHFLEQHCLIECIVVRHRLGTVVTHSRHSVGIGSVTMVSIHVAHRKLIHGRIHVGILLKILLRVLLGSLREE
jgi:hypothetical protein